MTWKIEHIIFGISALSDMQYGSNLCNKLVRRSIIEKDTNSGIVYCSNTNLDLQGYSSKSRIVGTIIF